MLVRGCNDDSSMNSLTMKKFSQLALAAISLFIDGSAFAYPPVEYESCIEKALESVFSKGLNNTLEDVENYCDCALTKIMDERKSITSSINYCNATYMQ